MLVLSLTASQLTAFALNEVPRQFAICAGQIKTVHQGVFGLGQQLQDFVITSIYNNGVGLSVRAGSYCLSSFTVDEVQKETLHNRGTFD